MEGIELGTEAVVNCVEVPTLGLFVDEPNKDLIEGWRTQPSPAPEEQEIEPQER